jgi:hypothetical protein
MPETKENMLRKQCPVKQQTSEKLFTFPCLVKETQVSACKGGQICLIFRINTLVYYIYIAYTALQIIIYTLSEIFHISGTIKLIINYYYEIRYLVLLPPQGQFFFLSVPWPSRC